MGNAEFFLFPYEPVFEVSIIDQMPMNGTYLFLTGETRSGLADQTDRMDGARVWG